MLNHEELSSFVAVGILGESDRQPLSIEDAALALSEWIREGVELPDGITAQALSDEWNRQLAADATPENHSAPRRYVIQYSAAQDAGSPVRMVTYAAELAENAHAAAESFRRKHPGRQICSITPVQDKESAFMRYGQGAWTDEEQAEYRSRLSANYDRSRIEHAKARETVSTFTLDEFIRELEHATRRAQEPTQNAEGVHVGDVFYSCWGYDQTNYDFYQVVGLRGKHTAVLRQNACKSEMCSDYSGYKRPLRDVFYKDDEYTCRVKICEYDGKPEMCCPRFKNHRITPVEPGKLYQHSTGA